MAETALATSSARVRTSGWTRWVQVFWTRVYFERVTSIGAERLRSSEPVLYVGLHRNGAVDGLIQRRVLRAPEFMVAAKWTKGPLGIFFRGIPVVRDRDEGDRSANAEALRRCVEHLRSGGELSIFPEGTSTLGPRHLPFKKGVARILAAYLASDRAQAEPPITVLPIGLFYEKAWEFRSKLEVVVGEPIDTRLAAGMSDEERVTELHARIARALEEVGVQFADEREQSIAEALAYASTLGTRRVYSRSLKALERGIPEPLRRAWDDLERSLAGRRVWRHQGVPLVPISSAILYVLYFLLVGPLALAALVLNLPPVVAGAWAGAKLADDRNVIALWRILVGVPVFALWAIASVVAMLVFLGPWWMLAYVGLTWLGLHCVYRARKLAVALHNVVFASSLRPKLLAVHRLVLETLPE
jgi:1-acyl-sn-glycerol-3-phosphate acyltransferase